MHDVSHHNRRSDTTCFYRHDLIDIRIPENGKIKFFCHLIKQHGIHLMVNKSCQPLKIPPGKHLPSCRIRCFSNSIFILFYLL